MVDVITPAEWRDDFTDQYQVDVNGTLFNYQGAFRPWSISAPDADTVRFELHDRDVYGHDAAGMNSERDEFASADDVAAVGQPLDVSYRFMVEPGDPNSAQWLVMGQLHQDLDSTGPGPPPVAIILTGEHMGVVVRYTGADGKQVEKILYTDPLPINRGSYYDMDIKTVIDPTGTSGRLVVTRDGITIADYSGPIGDPSMKGVYWAEGVYRQSAASETIAINYSGLTFATGDGVVMPSPSDFIGVPKLNPTSHMQDVTGAFVTSFAGTVRPGSTVVAYAADGHTVAGSAQADADGRFSIQLSVPGPGTYTFYPQETEAGGRAGLIAGGFTVVVATASDAAAQLLALHQSGTLGALILTDTNIIPIADPTFLPALVKYPELARIEGPDGGPVLIRYSAAITGRSYDQQQNTYALDGTLIEMQRLSAGRVVFDQTYNGATTTTTSWNSDGSRSLSSVANGVTTVSETFDPAGRLVTELRNFGFGRREVDTFDPATGKLAKTSVFEADGSRVDLTYGITGRNYVTQVTVSSGGQVALSGRFDANGRIVQAGDAATGLTAQFTLDPTTGARLGYRLIAGDGSYSVTSYAGGGTAVARTDHYSAKGVLLGSDQVDPLGSMTLISKAVALNAPLAPSPTLGLVEAGGAGYAAALSIAGQVGSQVAISDGGTLVGTTTVDATGILAVPLSGMQTGLHTLSLVATDPASGSGAATALDVDIASSGTMLHQLATLATDRSLAAIILTDSQRIAVASRAELAGYLRYASTLAKVQSGVQFALTQAVNGRGFDHQTSVYDGTGATVQVENYLNGFETAGQTMNGQAGVTLFNNSDGSHGLAFGSGGVSAGSVGFDAAGNVTSNQTRFADGWSQLDIINPATGQVMTSTLYGADGSRIETSYGIVGRGYVQQTTERDAASHIAFVARYDSAGHLVFLSNAATGAATTYQYDANGVETGYQTMQADGTHSTTVLSGAQGSPITDHYAARGALVGEDASDPAAAGQAAFLAVLAAGQSGHARVAGFIAGTSGNDVLAAGAGSSLLVGGAGADVLGGGAGDDILIGGAGADVMSGGGGRDVFWFGPGDFGSATTVGSDRITDFLPGDRIDLSGLQNSIAGHAGLSFIGTADFTGMAGQVHSFEVGGATYVAGDLDGDKLADFTIRLDGHHPLAAANFYF